MIDYGTIISVVVGVLATLVTALIGWQIYNIVYLRKIIKKETRKQAEYGAKTALFVSLAQQGMSLHNQNKTADAAQLLFNAIGTRNSPQYKVLDDEAYSYCQNILAQYEKDGVEITVSSNEDRKAYIRAALSTENDDIITLANKIKVQ